MSKWYGNYVVLCEEPTTEVYDKCVEELKKSIPDDIGADMETLKVIYKTPNEVGDPFNIGIDPETDEYEDIGPFWTIAVKIKGN